jgi:hypothetical protein
LALLQDLQDQQDEQDFFRPVNHANLVNPVALARLNFDAESPGDPA